MSVDAIVYVLRSVWSDACGLIDSDVGNQTCIQIEWWIEMW